jgi:hypothetical protein
MKNVLLLAVAVAMVSFVAWKSTGASDLSAHAPTPVLVELFTSEGCSSCPPADALLQQLDQSQIPGAQLIVLSEHVDYWDHDGWKDPHSSHSLTDRQSVYADHFRLKTVYTPQIVVDGAAEFLGSNGPAAKQAIEKARDLEKLPVRISAISVENPGGLQAHVEADGLPESSRDRKAEMYVVVALNHAESQVAAGENKGRRISHVAVVQSLTKVGSVEKGKNFAKDVRIKLDSGTDPANLRLIAFVQEPGQGRVLGAALQRVEK